MGDNVDNEQILEPFFVFKFPSLPLSSLIPPLSPPPSSFIFPPFQPPPPRREEPAPAYFHSFGDTSS